MRGYDPVATARYDRAMGKWVKAPVSAAPKVLATQQSDLLSLSPSTASSPTTFMQTTPYLAPNITFITTSIILSSLVTSSNTTRRGTTYTGNMTEPTMAEYEAPLWDRESGEETTPFKIDDIFDNVTDPTIVTSEEETHLNMSIHMGGADFKLVFDTRGTISPYTLLIIIISISLFFTSFGLFLYFYIGSSCKKCECCEKKRYRNDDIELGNSRFFFNV